MLTNVKGYVEQKMKDAAFGAHNFGSAGDGSTETIRLSYNDGKFLLDGDKTLVTDVTIKDDRIKTRMSAGVGSVIYGYSEAELVEAAGVQVVAYELGTVVSDVKVTSNGVGMPVGTHRVTLSYAGDEIYAPCETTVTLNVTKATIEIDYDSQIVTYGTNYNFNIAVSPYRHNNGELANPEMIEFMIGLDADKLSYNRETAGVEGAVAFVYLRLPKSISSIPMVGELLNGVTTLGDLIDLVNSMSGALGLDASSMETLSQVMGVLTGLNDYMEIQVIIESDEFKPTDVGIYIAGAVTIDENYETAYTADYLIIVPVTNEVTLDWNRDDENGVMTLPLLEQNRDEYLGAHVVEDIDLEGIAKVRYLVLGMNNGDDGVLSTDIYGNIKANIWTSNAGIKSTGAYLQIAYLVNWGNEIYYAMPIARAFAVVPAVAEVVLVGATGEPNRDLHKVFNNEEQGFSVKVYSQGEMIYSDHYQDAVNKLPENATVVVYYVGVQTNGKMYVSTDKPIHAGAYAAAAIYLDGNTGTVTLPENTEELVNAIAELKEFGADAGVLVIEPSRSTITMNEQVIKPFNADGYVVNDVMNIVTTSEYSSQHPDKTVITASIAATGDFSENGWKAITGEVNVDFPEWVDVLLPQIAPGVVDGITIAELNDKLLNKVPEIVSKLEGVISSENILSKLPEVSAKLEEYGLTNELVDKLSAQLMSVLDGVGEQLEKLPDTVTLNFTSDYTVDAVGAYVVLGIVTDSDHYPSADAGILVIVPTVDRVYLKWNYEDTNGIFTRELLEYIDYVDMFATPYDDANYTNVFDKYATDITYRFIGIDVNGDLVVSKADETKGHADVKALNNGAYIELAYIELEAAGHIVISDLIARPVILIPNAADVEFVDANENHILLRQFNGQQQIIDKDDITVTYNGELLGVDKQYLTVYYTGVQNNGQTYKLSTEAPVHAGAYVATALYAHKDDNGSVVAIGIDAISMIVSILPSTVEVSGGTVYYDGEVHTATVEATDEHGNEINDYILISGTADITGDVAEAGFDAFTATVNVELPTWMKEALEKLEIATENVPVQEVKEFIDGHINDLTEKIPENLLTELKSILDKLSPNVTVNLVDEVDYTDVGTYLYFGIVADFDHFTSVDTGLLEIVPAEVTIKVAADQGKVYGEDEPVAYDYTVEMINGKVNEEDLNVVITRVEGEDVGEYAFNVSYTENDNYVVTVEAGVFTITQATASVAIDHQTKVYGEDDPELTYTFTVTAGVITEEGIGLSIDREDGDDVGEYAITATYTESDNYVVLSNVGTFSITPAEVTITVDNQTKVYGEDDPELTYKVEGLKNGDTEDVLNIKVGREAGEEVGEYVITATYTESDNYVVTVEAGVFAITQKAITSVEIVGELTYNGEAQTPELTVKAGEEILSSDCYTVEVTAQTNPGTYDVTVKGTGNYTGEITVQWEITKAKPQIISTSRTLLLQGMIYINQYIVFENFDLTKEEIVANGGMEIEYTKNGVKYEYEVPLAYSAVYNGKEEFIAKTNGIPVKEMGDEMIFRPYVTVDGEKVYAEEDWVYSVRMYCESRIQKSSNVELKSALAALMNYGAEAQKYFSYRTDVPMNANLQSYVDAGYLKASDLELNWTDDLLTAAKEPSAEMCANFVKTDSIAKVSTTLNLKGALYITYYAGVGMDNAKFADATEHKFYFWTADDYSKLAATGTALSKANASYSKDATLEYSSQYGYEYVANSHDFYARMYSDTVYAVLCVTDSEGVEHCSGVLAYSPEVFAANKLNDGKSAQIDNVVQWMVVYGERAKIYLANRN